MLNTLELLIKDVKRGIYPLDEYLHDFLPMTFHYFVELERCTGFDFTKGHITKCHESLLPVFTIYEAKSNDLVGKDKKVRTPDILRKFLDQDNKLDDSQKNGIKIAYCSFSQISVLMTLPNYYGLTLL